MRIGDAGLQRRLENGLPDLDGTAAPCWRMAARSSWAEPWHRKLSWSDGCDGCVANDDDAVGVDAGQVEDGGLIVLGFWK